jgi:hypothetical protein
MSVLERIRRERLVAVLRRVPDVDARVAALADVGVGVIEITLDDPDAVDAIGRARARGNVSAARRLGSPDSAAAVPAAWPIAMHVPIDRADACASCVAEKQRPATSTLSRPCGCSARNGIPYVAPSSR